MIPESHPRRESLLEREKLVEGMCDGVVVPQGLIAHGRGECFDYLLGETSIPPALEAERAAAAMFHLAKHPVISVNGNVAVLAAREVVELSEATGALIEVNLFYRTRERAKAIADLLYAHGARQVLGVDDATARIPGLDSMRGLVSPNGIYKADYVLLGIEDGDRTEALVRIGKTVAAIDLNPLSRTSLAASIPIVDHIKRALTNIKRYYESMSREEASRVINSFNPRKVIADTLLYIRNRLETLARQLMYDYR
ncbi:phosphopantothenate/pantothenate synthetase [Pyrolobus fumarii]|uniref:phosphopantothenate/pantothenate synthetase n=1 Tax=Pyrolobus fumarii TaxID=54252 RepID=UPI00064E9C4A